MPTFEFKSPQGQTYSIQGPDGATPEQAFQILQQHLGGAAAAPPPDKYQQAALDEQSALQAAGGDTGTGLTRRLAHGATLGADTTLLAGMETPLEMIKRGTFSPAEGYDYAKAREDLIMQKARENTGAAGTAAEMLGGAVTGGNLAGGVGSMTRGAAGNLVTSAQPALSTGAMLSPGAGLAARAASSAADAGAFGGFSGAMEGNGLQERIKNALKGAGTGALVGGAFPVAGAVASAATRPITSNIRAILNPEAYGNSQVARAMHESGLSPQAIDDAVQQAGREGQGIFNVADAMGNAGQELLGSAARGAGEARTAVVNTLEGRQGTQGRRISNALAEGFNAPETAAQTEARMTAARGTAADAEYGAVRGGSQPVDVVGPINHLDQIIGTQPGQHVTPPNDSIEAALTPFRQRLARVNPDDFEAVQRIRGDMADAAESARRGGQGNRARLIGGAVRQLDIAMEAASPGYRAANANFAQASRNIEAVDTGRQAATRGRTEDTIPRFQALQPEGQQAFRSGYVDPLITQTQGAAFGANKARPLLNDAFQTEAMAMAPRGPLTPSPLQNVYDHTMRDGRRLVSYMAPSERGNVVASFALDGSHSAELRHIGIAGLDTEADAMNVLGPSAVRDMLRHFQQLHPEVTEITAHRFSGARTGGVYAAPEEAGARDITIPIPAPQPLRANRMMRQIEREQTMFETRATALGGSQTAKNLAHDTALGVSPHLIGQVLTGNVHGAIRSILAAGSNVLTGNTPAVRQQVANVLLRNGSNMAPGQLRDMVQNTVARIQFVQNIARNLGRGAAAGLAVEGPGQGRQR